MGSSASESLACDEVHGEDHSPTLDSDRADRLRRIAFAAFIDRGTAEVVEAFAVAGVPSVVLRGPAIATWLYDHPAERQYGDVDLLVQPERLAAAHHVLEELGFSHELIRATQHDHTFHDEVWLREALLVDLHRTLSGAGASPSAVWQALTEEVSQVAIGEVELPVLAVPGRSLVVVLHAAHHGIEFAKPLEDLRRAVARVPIEIWRQTTALAGELDALGAFAAGLRLVPEGSSLAERLELSHELPVDAALRAASAPPMAIALEWLAHGPLSRRQKLAFAVRKVFPPPAFLRSSSRLANRGPVGLVAAYVVRVGSLASRLPGGMASLRRARREVLARDPSSRRRRRGGWPGSNAGKG